METFLKIVAADLYSRKSGNLGRTAVVFPNKRASLFFNEYLSQQSDAPLWSPAYISISELFRNLSPLETGDSIKLICELYKVLGVEAEVPCKVVVGSHIGRCSLAPFQCGTLYGEVRGIEPIAGALVLDVVLHLIVVPEGVGW